MMNGTPEPALKDFSCVSTQQLYDLFKDIYSSSDAMSESLEDKYPDLRCLEEDVSAIHRLPGAVAMVAELDQKPAAYVVIRPRPQLRLRHTAELSMGVAHFARGRRLGSLLLQVALDRVSADNHIEIIYLMVRSDNRAAIRIYASAGFEEMALLDRDTKIGNTYFDGILMRKFVKA